MIAHYTAEIFRAFILGAAGIIAGGLLFESGKQYVKTAGSHQFKGKIEALPFFFVVVIFGYFLQWFTPIVDDVVYSIPASARLGVMVVTSMILFNNSVDNFRYSDTKSVTVYAVGLAMILLPYL